MATDFPGKFKKWFATLTGGEQAPGPEAAEKFRQETVREEELAKERERTQQERMKTQGGQSLTPDIPIDVPEEPQETSEDQKNAQ